MFSSLRANDLIWQYVVNSYLKGKAPPAFDLLYWNATAPTCRARCSAGTCATRISRTTCASRARPCSAAMPVDLSKIDVPAFIYASRDDHIVPWRTAYASNELLAGETTFVLGASGHIAGVINPPAKNKRNYWIGGNRRGRRRALARDRARAFPEAGGPTGAAGSRNMQVRKVAAPTHSRAIANTGQSNRRPGATSRRWQRSRTSLRACAQRSRSRDSARRAFRRPGFRYAHARVLRGEVHRALRDLGSLVLGARHARASTRERVGRRIYSARNLPQSRR